MCISLLAVYYVILCQKNPFLKEFLRPMLPITVSSAFGEHLAANHLPLPDDLSDLALQHAGSPIPSILIDISSCRTVSPKSDVPEASSLKKRISFMKLLRLAN